jgi:hypothetical protein
MVQATRKKYIAIFFLCDDLIIKLDIVSQSCLYTVCGSK